MFSQASLLLILTSLKRYIYISSRIFENIPQNGPEYSRIYNIEYKRPPSFRAFKQLECIDKSRVSF